MDIKALALSIKENPAFIYASKNAVNAALLAAAQVYHDPADNNFHTWHGLYGIGYIIVSAVVIREVIVYFPRLLRWSQTVDDKVSGA